MEQEERDDQTSESSSYSPKAGRGVSGGFTSAIEESAKKVTKRPGLDSTLENDLESSETKKMLQQTTINFSINLNKNMNLEMRETPNQRFSSTKSNYYLPQLNSPLKIKRDNENDHQVHIHNSMQPKIKKLKNVNYYKHMKEKYKAKREQADNEEKKIQEFLDSRNQTITKFEITSRDGFGTTKSAMTN